MLLAPLGAHAGSALVAVSNGSISPDVLFLDPGADVLFDWRQGEHHLVAYREASWDSGEQPTPNTFRVPFDGGTVRYRCTIHSRIDSGGICNGMCGIITDDPDLDITRPLVEVTSPRRGQIVVPLPAPDLARRSVRFPVRIEGRAQDNVDVTAVGVRLWDNAGRSFDLVAECPGCKKVPAVTWYVDVSLLPGTYLLEASAADAMANRGYSSRQMFIVA